MSCLQTLKQKELKLTPQRRLIVDIIHNAQGHISAEEIIGLVQARMPGVNKSTIYRTLEVLERAGCVYKSESADGAIYHHAEEGRHHHLVCRVCGKTAECQEELFEPIAEALLKNYGFQADFNHIVVEGLCSACRKSQ
jgi:Fur family ferric uptake transcriptional regulator